MESLENLKVGDKVFYNSSATIGIYKINRLTKTQIILSNKQRFRKKDGRLVGDDNMWSETRISLLTPEGIEKITLVKLRKEAIRLRDNLAIPLDKETLKKLIAEFAESVDAIYRIAIEAKNKN